MIRINTAYYILSTDKHISRFRDYQTNKFKAAADKQDHTLEQLKARAKAGKPAADDATPGAAAGRKRFTGQSQDA